jgi:hypothetical protein
VPIALSFAHLGACASDVFLQGEVARYPIAFDVSDCLDENSSVALLCVGYGCR